MNLPDSALVAILAIGAAFYVPLGSRRGYIQGTYGFKRLAINLVLEGAVRLGGSFLLILSGLGVRGVIEANAAAVAVAYLAIAPKLAARVPNPLSLSYALRETSQALVFFSGQVLINNCDIVLVKHFFAAQEAGLYAAVAMVGRVIFAFSSAVVNTDLSPCRGHSKRREKRSQSHRNLAAAGIQQRFHPGTWPVHHARQNLDFVIRIGLRGRRQVQSPRSAGALRLHHRGLLAQRCDYHFRDVVQNRNYELGAIGLQWRGDRRHLPFPFLFAPGYRCATAS